MEVVVVDVVVVGVVVDVVPVVVRPVSVVPVSHHVVEGVVLLLPVSVVGSVFW